MSTCARHRCWSWGFKSPPRTRTKSQRCFSWTCHLSAGERRAEPGGVGEQWGRPLHPPVHGDVIDFHAAFDEESLRRHDRTDRTADTSAPRRRSPPVETASRRTPASVAATGAGGSMTSPSSLPRSCRRLTQRSRTTSPQPCQCEVGDNRGRGLSAISSVGVAWFGVAEPGEPVGGS